MKNTTTSLSALAALALASTLALTGCTTTGSAVDDAPAAAASVTAADAITIDDAWVKAADEGMSAVFGSIANTGDAEITLVSAETTAAHMVELHETVDDGSGAMVMREREGGFAIAAHESLLLEPGANHLMLMGLTDALRAGDEITVTLTFSDGSSHEFSAPVKDYSGANENYVGDGDMAH